MTIRRTLLLDLDGTLVDSAPDLLASGNRLMRAQGLAPFAMAELRPMIGDGVGALVARMLAARGRTAGERDVAAFMEEYLPHVAVATRPYPGVAGMLEALKAAGWRLAVCTNKPAGAARRLLDAVGLLGMMAAVGGGDGFGVRKPDPRHLLLTLAAAGGEASRALMLGDHANDVRAARGAGLPCLFAAWGYGDAAMAQGAAAEVPLPSDVPGLAERVMPASVPR